MNSNNKGSIAFDVLYLVHPKVDESFSRIVMKTNSRMVQLFRTSFLQARDYSSRDCKRRLLTIASMIKVNQEKISELCHNQSFDQSSKTRLLAILDKIRNLRVICSTTKSIKYKFFFKIIRVVTKLVTEIILAVARMPNTVLLL